MEKRRRARINQYLDELKTFILENEKDVSDISVCFLNEMTFIDASRGTSERDTFVAEFMIMMKKKEEKT